MEPIEVRILEREYRLAAAPDERTQLVQAARMLDERMRAIRDAGRVSGLDRIAVMAALQLAHELIQANDGVTPRSVEADTQRIRRMTQAIDEVLRRQEAA